MKELTQKQKKAIRDEIQARIYYERCVDVFVDGCPFDELGSDDCGNCLKYRLRLEVVERNRRSADAEN